MTTRGIGLAGETPLASIRAAALAAERAGYDSFWLSQPLEGSSLAKLARAAAETQHIRLGVGAIPFTGLTPAQMVAQIADHGLPPERLRLGVGSGTGPGSLDRLRQGVAHLRSLTDVEIVVAPLGPQMSRLAGEVADTVLLNWLTPVYAEQSAQWVRDGAAAAGRTVPVLACYVRCAMGDEVRPRLEAECMRYGSFPHYAAHFARQGVQPIETTIHASDESELRSRFEPYEAVLDEVIARVITPHDSPSQILAIIEAASGAHYPITPSPHHPR
jgi:alkanesulfonate monooxygenase SsuD/methylene tetrahydromethanopterin reductase-like flavin-dependent oxidoreductase (luciferase family)